MATKNLARTVIEGGRTGSNTWDRRQSHTFERASEKEFLTQVTKDPEMADEYDITPRPHVYKEFNDKLGPIYRWLERQVGRPWDEVRSEVSTTFDTRTTAGRHIVYDHLLNQVSTGPDYKYGRRYDPNETTSYYRYDFYVDDAGVLRQKEYIRRNVKMPLFDTNRIAGWLSGRVVGKVGDKLFWFVPTGKNKKHRGGTTNHKWKCEWTDRSYTYYSYTYGYRGGLQYMYSTIVPLYKTDNLGRQVLEGGLPVVIGSAEKWEKVWIPNVRQDRKLNDKELAFWNTIPEPYQKKVLERSPTYPNPPKDPRYYW